MSKDIIEQKSYTGKLIYVGIDVHKKSYSVTCLCEGLVVKRVSMKASPEALVEFLKKHFPGASIKTAYEAGFSGFVLHRFLVNHGIDNQVVHAASIEVSARDRVKTDKRDSLKIATQLSHGRLTCIYIPSEEREAYRGVTRLRESVMKDRKRVGNQLKSFLYIHGLITDEEEKVSQKWIKEILKLKVKVHREVFYCLESYAAQWLMLNKKLKAIDQHLEEQAKGDKSLEQIYRSVPGIGKTHARALSNELEDMKHFKNEKGLFSFTGLTPSEHSSGEHKRQGHISRQGRSSLRKMLVQAAWIAIKKDGGLKAIFERLSIQSGKKRAIIGIARRLIGRIRACFMTGCLYELGKGVTGCVEVTG